MKTLRRVQTEYLINNIIDEDFQFMLYPLSLVQSLFFMSRFSIINNFITPDNNVSFHIRSLIGCVILVVSQAFRFIAYHDIATMVNSVIIFLLEFDVILFSLTSVVTYIVSSVQRNNVVEIIIRLQHALNCFKIDKKKFLYKHKLQNWASVFLMVTVHFISWLSTSPSFGFLDLLVGFYLSIPTIVFDMQVVYATRTIVMIKNELIVWNNLIEEYGKMDIAIETETADQASLSHSNMFDAYDNIVKAFRLCNEVYQFSFIYCTFMTFVHILINVEFCLNLQEANLGVGILHSASLVFAIVFENVKNFMLLVTLSVACASFYKTVRIAEGVCAQILSNTEATDMHKTCKNVLRLNSAALNKLSAFGIFHVDAAFPLRLLSVIVTYTVVLLQFAFLS